jgi:hypothetical protein
VLDCQALLLLPNTVLPPRCFHRAGLTCAWDYSTRPGHGVCKKIDRCAKEGSSCSHDEDCCRGTRCKDNGKCAAPVCWKRCSDYRCYEERKRDCEAMAAAAASS